MIGVSQVRIWKGFEIIGFFNQDNLSKQPPGYIYENVNWQIYRYNTTPPVYLSGVIVTWC